MLNLELTLDLTFASDVILFWVERIKVSLIVVTFLSQTSLIRCFLV